MCVHCHWEEMHLLSCVVVWCGVVRSGVVSVVWCEKKGGRGGGLVGSS